jgi:CheY-like chemotaxis protein
MVLPNRAGDIFESTARKAAARPSGFTWRALTRIWTFGRSSRPSSRRAVKGETILVVEDDAAVRLLITAVLEELGSRYVEAAGAPQAMTILRSSVTIDLLLTDVGLPMMNGRQLAEFARESRPEIKVLFVTGYAENAAVRGGFLDRGMDMLTKPFLLNVLGLKIREMIGPAT